MLLFDKNLYTIQIYAVNLSNNFMIYLSYSSVWFNVQTSDNLTKFIGYKEKKNNIKILF